MRLLAVALLLALGGCSAMQHQEKPRTFYEEVAYQEAKAQGMAKSVDQLTCHRGYDAKGLCLDPGKPLKPAQALAIQQKIAEVRRGMRVAVSLPDGAVGMCVGASRTAQQCLLAASQLLLEAELLLREYGG